MPAALIGDPIDRVDGRLKVTGAADYPSDATFPGLLHATLVQSTIAAGTITAIDTEAARDAPGVRLVLTHRNAPTLADQPPSPFSGAPRYPFKDNRIVHRGQHVALVVAETLEQATAAARLITVEYAETTPIVGIENPQAEVVPNAYGMDFTRGDVTAALATAEVLVDEQYATAPCTNNPMGLFATAARWENDKLLVHESTQWPVLAHRCFAGVFSLPDSDVRVLVPFIGGGFGAGLQLSPHSVLTALAARMLDQPVRLVLTRPQMFTSIGHRPETVQRVRLGATRDGHLVAIDHEARETVGLEEFNPEPVTMVTSSSYACPNVATRDSMVRLNIPNPGAMRAPGTTEGSFGLESALDELSYQLGIDPIELRLRNYADAHPPSGRPWSSKALRECYRVGADRFGWWKRNPEVRSMRDGNWLIGYGMAGVTFERFQGPCQVRLSIARDGSADVGAATTDLGTGTYTIATQLAAQLLGLELAQVRVELGDSDLPPAPQSGGSGVAMSLSSAIYDGAEKLLRAFLIAVAADSTSPLRGRHPDSVTASGGRIHLVDDPSVGESYVDILARHQLDRITVEGSVDPQLDNPEMAAAGAFAARFVEVRVDEELGLLRIARIVSAVDGGRILNEKTARSQLIGGTVMGIGMTLFEETTFDTATGRIANATFGDYLIPVSADVPDLDVVFVGEPDAFTPVGAKGIGELGIVGIPAAIANAIHHATGRRLRTLPIRIEGLL